MLRLTAEQESVVHKLLHEGIDRVVQSLKHHYIEATGSTSDHAFRKTLLIIAETVAKLASMEEFNNKGVGRVAFLPGYMKTDQNRITYDLSTPTGALPSDIAFQVCSECPPTHIPGISNQCLLFDALLSPHLDCSPFVEGGTHQFLVANSSINSNLKSDAGYRTELLQVSAEAISFRPDVATIAIYIDFNTCTSVGQLFDVLNSRLNRDNPVHRWPLNFSDASSQPSEAIYTMRGYLIALWYKLLNDPHCDVDKSFIECIDLAKSLHLAGLASRIDELRKNYRQTSEERYLFWYSLTFAPVINFTSQISNAESIGSGMIMTDFELPPSFFFYIHPWLRSVYRSLRSFETLIHEGSIIEQRITQELLNQKSIYLPSSFYGEGMNKKTEKFRLPISKYFLHTFIHENPTVRSTAEDIYTYAHKCLLHMARFYWYHIASEVHKEQPTSVRTTILKNLQANESKLFGTLNHKLNREYSKKHSAESFGDISVRDSLDFCNKLFGRMFTLGCYLGLGLSCAATHACLNGQIDFETSERDGDSRWKYLNVCFFIHGLRKDHVFEGDFEDGINRTEIYEGISIKERQVLVSWWTESVNLLKNGLPDLTLNESEYVRNKVQSYVKRQPEELALIVKQKLLDPKEIG